MKCALRCFLRLEDTILVIVKKVYVNRDYKDDEDFKKRLSSLSAALLTNFKKLAQQLKDDKQSDGKHTTGIFITSTRVSIRLVCVPSCSSHTSFCKNDTLVDSLLFFPVLLSSYLKDGIASF